MSTEATRIAVTETMSALSDPMLRRLRRQEHSDPRTQAFVQLLDLPDTAVCLEIGAGLGSIARWLATDVAASGQVLATEVRPELVSRIGARGLTNLEAIKHDIRADALPGQRYDLIFTRYVLEHLPDRKMILAHLSQSLKPGGWLVVEDAVFHEPALTGPPAYRSAMLAFAEGKHGTDYLWGQSLPMEMSAAGLHQISAQQIQDLFDSGSELALFFASVLLQERDTRRDDDATCTAALEEAVALLVGGRAWFSGPVVVQCAGRADPSLGTEEAQ